MPRCVIEHVSTSYLRNAVHFKSNNELQHLGPQELRLTRTQNRTELNPYRSLSPLRRWLFQEAASKSQNLKNILKRKPKKNYKERKTTGRGEIIHPLNVPHNIKNKSFSFKYNPTTAIPYHLFQTNHKVPVQKNSIQHFLCIVCINCKA